MRPEPGCGGTKMTGRCAGEPFPLHYRYIDIHVKRDGRWAVCSIQITAVSEARRN